MDKSIICELAQAGLIRLAGEDALVFLQNQLTCDVTALGTLKSTYGAYCTPKGRALASFLLWRTEQGFFMQIPSSLREPIQKQLTKYILRSQVKATDVPGEWAIIGVAGEDAEALVQRATGVVPRQVHEVTHTADITVIHLPAGRYEILATRDRSARIMESLCSGADNAEPEHWDWLDIRAGIPTILPATQEEFVPQMLNLDALGGVSLTKGCYPGQEIVARMHYRGTLKQRMVLANLASGEVPQPGEKLFSPAFGEQACGTVVNAARSLEGGCDLLAVLQIAAAGKGDIHWKAPDGALIRILPLPYELPSA